MINFCVIREIPKYKDMFIVVVWVFNYEDVENEIKHH